MIFASVPPAKRENPLKYVTDKYAPFPAHSLFSYSWSDRPERGQRLRLGRYSMAFRVFGFFRPRSERPKLSHMHTSSYTCKGGRVSAYGVCIISLVSFVEKGSYTFQARNLCYRFSVMVSGLRPEGHYFGLRPTHPLSAYGLRPPADAIYSTIYESGIN